MTAPARPAADRLKRLVEGFEGRRVAVLGDLVADEFVHGDIARISREAPVLILEHRETVVVPGGGANAVANLRALGAAPLPVGLVGRDPSGERLLAHFRGAGVRTAGVLPARSWETPTKSRVLAGGIHTRRQQIVRLDRGSGQGRLARDLREALRLRLGAALGRAEGLLVADYGYGAAAPEMLRGLLPRGLPVTVDSRWRVERFRGTTACTPNQEEVERALDLAPLRSPRDVEEAGRELLRRSGGRAVLVTRGARGMVLVERGRPAVHIPAWGGGEVADVTGAGDTVIAVFTLGLLAGGTFLEAATLANRAAGLVVMKAGTATISPRELLRAVREGA